MHAPRHRHSRGFTVVEVIVALTLLTVGVLSFTAGIAACLRLATRSRATSRVADAVLDRTSALRTTIAAGGCGATPSAAAAPAGMTVDHRLTVSPPLVDLSVMVQWQRLGIAGGDTVRTAIAC